MCLSHVQTTTTTWRRASLPRQRPRDGRGDPTARGAAAHRTAAHRYEHRRRAALRQGRLHRWRPCAVLRPEGGSRRAGMGKRSGRRRSRRRQTHRATRRSPTPANRHPTHHLSGLAHLLLEMCLYRCASLHGNERWSRYVAARVAHASWIPASATFSVALAGDVCIGGGAVAAAAAAATVAAAAAAAAAHSAAAAAAAVTAAAAAADQQRRQQQQRRLAAVADGAGVEVHSACAAMAVLGVTSDRLCVGPWHCRACLRLCVCSALSE